MNNPEEILKNNPGSVVFARYAEELVREGKIDEAREIAENGIKANPTYAPGHSVLAEILFQQNSEEEAIEELKTAIHLDPQMPNDLFKLGKNYLNQNQLDDAKPYIWAAHKFEPLVSDVQNIYKEAKLSEDTSLAEQSEETLLEDTAEPETDVSETVVMSVAEVEEPVIVEDVDAETPEQDVGEEAEDVVSHEEPESLETLVGVVGEQSAALTEETMEESELSDTEEPGFDEEADIQSIEEEISDVESESAEKVTEEEYDIEEDVGFDTLIGKAVESDQALREEAESLETAGKEETSEEETAGLAEIDKEVAAAQSFEEEITEDVTTIGDVESKQPEEEYDIEEDEEFDALLDETVESDQSLKEEVELLESAEKEETLEDAAGLAEIDGEETNTELLVEEITEDVTTIEDVESKQPEEEYGIEEDEEFDALLDETVESDQSLKEEVELLESAEKEETFEDTAGLAEIDGEETNTELLVEEITEDVTTIGDVESKQPEEEYGIEGDEELDALLDETVESDQSLKEEVELFESAGKEETLEEEAGMAVVDEEETTAELLGEEIIEDVSDHTEMPVDEKSDEPLVGSGSGDQPMIVNIMEIDEEEEYDPLQFERDALSAKGDAPVLSEEERSELLAYETMAEQQESEILEETFPVTESEAHDKLDEIIEVEPETDENNESNIDVEAGEFYSELTSEEADVLSVSGAEEMEEDRELELETKEGIDYSDVLSQKTFAPEMEEVIEEKDEILTDTGADVEKFSEIESGMECLDEQEDIFGTESLSSDTSGENLRIVEEMIKSAPDIEVPTMDEENEDVENLQLDELISDYENSLKEEPSVSPYKEYPQPEKNDYESFPDTDSSTLAGEEKAYIFPDESTLPEENITATMAEIYVSQNMIPRAIAIYEALLEKDPDNEKVKSRLKEMIELHNQQLDGP